MEAQGAAGDEGADSMQATPKLNPFFDAEKVGETGATRSTLLQAYEEIVKIYILVFGHQMGAGPLQFVVVWTDADLINVHRDGKFVTIAVGLKHPLAYAFMSAVRARAEKAEAKEADAAWKQAPDSKEAEAKAKAAASAAQWAADRKDIWMRIVDADRVDLRWQHWHTRLR